MMNRKRETHRDAKRHRDNEKPASDEGASAFVADPLGEDNARRLARVMAQGLREIRQGKSVKKTAMEVFYEEYRVGLRAYDLARPRFYPADAASNCLV